MFRTNLRLFATDAALASTGEGTPMEAPLTPTPVPPAEPEANNEGEEAPAPVVVNSYPDPKTDKDGFTKSWNNAMKGFKATTLQGKKFARQCAEMALIHFEAYGDTVYCQSFVDTANEVGKNYVRVQAFLAWAQEYSPLKQEGGRLVKDKSADAAVFDIAGALKISFWDFAPEQAIKAFDSQEVAKLLLGVVGKLRNTEKWQPKDNSAVDALNEADKAIRAVFAPKPTLVEKAA